METKRKKSLMNILMVVLIVIIAVCAVAAVGSLKGWFGTGEKAVMNSKKVSGVVNIERKGVAYSLNSDVELMAGDVVETKQGSSAELAAGDGNTIVLNENTELAIQEGSQGGLRLCVNKGGMFADLQNADDDLVVQFGKNEFSVIGNVLFADVQSGSDTLYLFFGKGDVKTENGAQEMVSAGELIQILTKESEEEEVSVKKLQAQALSEFAIIQAQKCESKNELCFSAAEFQKVLDDRAKEKMAALEASMQADRIALDEAEKQEELQTEMETELMQETSQEAEDADDAKEYVPEHTGGEEQYEEILECTIEIRCDTILDNMKELSKGKEAYVPANGCILSTSTVEFNEGDTVFDVLERVCNYAGIQLEYAWTPLYNSYYIEGINHLYEFDCGNESGWMYKVNGWFPNYGCSSYYLEDGDVIVWTYSCKGLGADVGGGVG